jgi:hypothetical protein
MGKHHGSRHHRHGGSYHGYHGYRSGPWRDSALVYNNVNQFYPAPYYAGQFYNMYQAPLRFDPVALCYNQYGMDPWAVDRCVRDGYDYRWG